MAIFHVSHRSRSLDDAARSGDSALNVLIILLLIAFGIATWYFYVTPLTNQANMDSSTITAPVTAPPQPNAAPVHPAPPPNPGP
jgi:hypothetical protein